jgi:hypothetical protein
MDKELVRAGVTALFGTVALLALSACDGGSATPARDHAAYSGSRTSSAYSDGAVRAGRGSADASNRDDPRREPVRLINGKPMWAANSRHTADENAEYQFNRDGADFGAKSVDDFVAKTHAFVDRPPTGALILTRNNGDKLIYDPKANVFAVVSKEGAPRTMFKPRDGAAYWDEQKQRQAESGRAGGTASGSRRSYRARAADRGGQDDEG